ncbi:DNA-binding protein HU [Candidatus Wolfebacteria bacterium]|nr:MAG: DNA-binding protein HU [Candidatus Wolfebacteria bacterium]
MNKQALAEWVQGELDGTKAQAERLVDGLFGAITDALKEGKEVSIAGFGAFTAKMRAARTARNPRTGEPVEVPAKRVPKFKAAKALKDAVAE